MVEVNVSNVGLCLGLPCRTSLHFPPFTLDSFPVKPDNTVVDALGPNITLHCAIALDRFCLAKLIQLGKLVNETLDSQITPAIPCQESSNS